MTRRWWPQGRSNGALLFLAALTSLATVAAPALAQCHYTLEYIAAPTCPPFSSHPVTRGSGLGDDGTVTGSYELCPVGPYHPFVWTPEGGFVPHLPPAGASEAAFGRNNDRWATLNAWLPGTAGGRVDLLTGRMDLVPTPAGVGNGGAADVNRAGVVVGARTMVGPPNWELVAYRRDPDGSVTDLGLHGFSQSVAQAINDAGDVVGYFGDPFSDARAFIWRGETVEILPPVPGGVTSVAADINRFGDVLIGGRIPSPTSPGQSVVRGFLRRASRLSPLGWDKHYDNVGAGDLNDRGQAVGSMNRPEYPFDSALLFQEGKAYDLNDLVVLPPLAFDHPRVHLQKARAINNDGWILCTVDAPVPGPGTVAALLRPIDPPRGDVTGDCAVDFDDLRAVLAQWSLTHAPADADADGVVGPGDLVLVLEGMAG